MELAYRLLSPDEIIVQLADSPSWKVEGGKVTRTFEFEEYLDGIAFVARVAAVAESLNHHPDIFVGYRKVTVSVNTHEVNGLSPYDFELARRLSALA